MRDIVFLCHRIPFPPDKGDKIRSWNILSYLSERYRVHLGCFIDDPRDWQYVRELKLRCHECYFAELQPQRARLRSAIGLMGRDPLTLHYYRHGGLRNWVERILRERRPDAIYAFSSAMAGFVPEQTSRSTRRIIDFVDVDSDKWRQYAPDRQWPVRWVYRRESQALLEFERKVAARFDASLFVSSHEAEFFRGLAPQAAHKVFPVQNGVDAEYFSPERDYATPYPPNSRVLVFSGAMDYRPNIDAVTWFARRVLPRIRRHHGDVQFAIVGSSPAPEVCALTSLEGVFVTGRVADVRPYLAHARLVLAPLRISRGVQNKVLEGMAMAKPVIVTPQGLEGISAGAEEVIVAPATEDEFADAVVRAMASDDLGVISRRARALVLEDYGWPASFARIDGILRGSPPLTARATDHVGQWHTPHQTIMDAVNRMQIAANAHNNTNIRTRIIEKAVD